MSGIRSNNGEINTDGYNYQLYTLLHCIDCLQSNDNVQEYTVGNAVVGFGALDDVVFSATLKRGEKITTAIQVKHSTTKNMIDERYLCQNTKTYLYKYFQSFVQIKKTTSLEQLGQLILWTNMPMHESIRDWFEDYVAESEKSDLLGKNSVKKLSYERYRIKNDRKQEIWKQKLKVSGQQMCESLEEEWGQFLNLFVIYLKVPNVDELKASLVRSIGNSFEDLCKLVEQCAVKQTTTSDQITRIFTLLNLRSSVENSPYAKLLFNDLEELQRNVKQLFDNRTKNMLRVKASQDVDCTVARLISVVEKCLAAESKRYLVFNYKTFSEKWNEIQQILSDSKLVEKGLKCLIIFSIADDQIRMNESKLSDLKVIYVGSSIETDYDDKFNISCIDDHNKNEIYNRVIRLSQWQSATAKEIFGDDLFHFQNHSIVLGLHKMQKDSMLQITVNEPSLDTHYRSRIAKLSYVNNISINLDLLNQNVFPKLIIYDLPGMGKTTEMIKLASDFRAKYQDHLVVYMHCNEAISKWSGCVSDLICNTVASCNDLTNQVVKKIVQLEKLVLIMDGYDEVGQKHNDKLKKMVSKIEHVRMLKLHIATRPQSKDEIVAILKECGLCHLEPFTEDDQLAYLTKFWNKENINGNNTQALINKNARYIINKFRSMMNGSSLIGIPLQTYMIAVTYANRILSSEFDTSECHTLAFIYKEFVELKFMNYVNRHFDSTNAAHAEAINSLRGKFLHDHVLAAIGFQDEADKLERIFNSQVKADSELEQLCDKIHQYGIVLKRPSLGFFHYTYQEYFLALYILTYTMPADEISHFINKYSTRQDSLVFRFMDDLLYDLDPRVNPVRSLQKSMYVSKLPTNYILPKTARLHQDKMIEMNAALDTWRMSDIQSFLLHLASNKMYNILELIYDSLKEDIRSRVQLCLHDRCYRHLEKYAFCLKSLKTAGNLIPILELLWKKNPDSFAVSFLGEAFYYPKRYGLTFGNFEINNKPSEKIMEFINWFTKTVSGKYKKQQTVVPDKFIQQQFEKWLERAFPLCSPETREKAVNLLMSTLRK